MKLYIKNMVCDRCKMVVDATLRRIGLHPTDVDLGEVELSEDDLPTAKRERLVTELEAVGFELLDDKRSRTVEKIKTVITELIQQKDGRLTSTLSHYLQQQLRQDYSALSHLFSEVEGITIEQYYIRQRIEKVKELLAYDELTLTEIAYRLQYSSVGYLSNQFKKVTGLTPSHFKRLRPIARKALDDL